jgi:hypothetical protein
MIMHSERWTGIGSLAMNVPCHHLQEMAESEPLYKTVVNLRPLAPRRLPRPDLTRKFLRLRWSRTAACRARAWAWASVRPSSRARRASPPPSTAPSGAPRVGPTLSYSHLRSLGPKVKTETNMEVHQVHRRRHAPSPPDAPW